MLDSNRRLWLNVATALVVLALPALAVHVWMAWTFPSYRSSWCGQDLVFSFAWCGLLLLVARRRLLWFASIALAVVAYCGWLFLVLGEAVSYYLQADTFNARFFANLDPDSLATGMRAFPWLIGGSVAVLATMVLVCIGLLVWLRRDRRRQAAGTLRGPAWVAGVILVLAVLGVDSAPRRLVGYFLDAQHSEQAADTPQGRAVALRLDLRPTPKDAVVAAPGKNVVWIYLESLERIYWDPKVFAGLTPNLDRLRAQGLDFSGFETFAGATFTIAGMFASQCGAPYLPSPIRSLDLGGNNANATAFQPSLTCFGDVLRRAGYTQVYLGGAPIKFSSKGVFYRMHGFNAALGLKQLEARAHHRLAESGWGLYDSELFPTALAEYKKLAAAGKPFNLSMITLDTHPPDGRPSPDCPKYAANPNSMLQAVHCTDYEVGKFVAELKQQPAWKNTVVVIMSDHLMMRNDAEPLYPMGYHRQPALLVLNAGQGVRPARMYHMDIAPTLLRLMGVRTNATFLAGSNRGAADAPDSPLTDTATDVAVLRKALWATAQPLMLCKRGILIGAGDDGVRIGGYPVPMSWRGHRRVGLWPHGAWVVSVNPHAVNGAVLTSALGNPLDEGGVAARLARRAPNESVLLVNPLDGTDIRKQFTVDWIGQHGGRTHLADVPRLRGLEISSPDCAALLRRMNLLPAGHTLDLSSEFGAVTTPLYPQLGESGSIVFDRSGVLPFEREVGWASPAGWGSFSVGDYARLGFTLPKDHCHAMGFDFKVHPYLPASWPRLDVGVYANGALLTTWHFGEQDTSTTWHEVSALVRTPDPQCRVDLKFVFTRPGAAPPPYPNGEDGRPLQLLFLNMRAAPDDLETTEVAP